MLLSFAGGVGLHQSVIRPVERGPQIRVVIVTIGLLLLINGAVTWIWSGEQRYLRSPFPSRVLDIGGVAISLQDIGTIARVAGHRGDPLGVLPAHEGRVSRSVPPP